MVLVFVIGLLLIVPLLLNFLTIRSNFVLPSKPITDLNQIINRKSRQRPVDKSTFTKTGYIIPLESNEKGTIYSPRAQIRGMVSSWLENTVTLEVGNGLQDVSLDNTVQLYCAPEYYTDKQGTKISARSVWMDLSKVSTLGKQVQGSTIPKKFPKGSDFLALVHVTENDHMDAYLIVGIGCKLN